jgi:hypothetical protein
LYHLLVSHVASGETSKPRVETTGRSGGDDDVASFPAEGGKFRKLMRTESEEPAVRLLLLPVAESSSSANTMVSSTVLTSTAATATAPGV